MAQHGHVGRRRGRRVLPPMRSRCRRGMCHLPPLLGPGEVRYPSEHKKLVPPSTLQEYGPRQCQRPRTGQSSLRRAWRHDGSPKTLQKGRLGRIRRIQRTQPHELQGLFKSCNVIRPRLPAERVSASCPSSRLWAIYFPPLSISNHMPTKLCRVLMRSIPFNSALCSSLLLFYNSVVAKVLTGYSASASRYQTRQSSWRR